MTKNKNMEKSPHRISVAAIPSSAVSMKVAMEYMCHRHQRIQAAKTLEGEGVLLIYTSGSIALMHRCTR
jgi:hypothetical protein